MTGVTIAYIIIFACGFICGVFFAMLFMEGKAQEQFTKCLKELEQARMNDHPDAQGRFVSHKG